MKRFIVGILLATLLLSLAGCGNNTAPNGKAELQKVTVALDWFPNTNHSGLYLAKDKGLFEAQGLDVQIVQPSAGGTAQLVAAGQADFGISYQEEVTTARSEDIPVVAIAAIIQHNTSGFASPAEKNIKTPADFEGKRYGGWGSPAESAMLKALMDKDDADVNKVEMINIGDVDFFTSVAKDVDFSWIYYGWTGIEAELRGMDLNFIALKDKDKALDFYTPVIIASEDKINKEGELISKFMKAVSQGYESAIATPDEAAQIFLKSVPEQNEELIKASQDYLSKQYQADAPRWGEMKSEVWKNYADFMYNNALIEKNINPEEAFTNEFLPE